MSVTTLEDLKDMSIHIMDIDDVSKYILSLDVFDTYGGWWFKNRLENEFHSEITREELNLNMDDGDVWRMWYRDGHVPRVIVKHVCSIYGVDFRKLSAEVVTEIM